MRGPLPKMIGHFTVVRELGRDGMGIVLEAEDEKLGRRVAIELMALHLADHPEAKSRFAREARTAAVVEHENVVPILHIGEDAEDVSGTTK